MPSGRPVFNVWLKAWFSVMKSPTKRSSTKTLINVVIQVFIPGGGGGRAVSKRTRMFVM